MGWKEGGEGRDVGKTLIYVHYGPLATLQLSGHALKAYVV